MAMSKYTPDANKIVHSTSVDFTSRPSIFEPVHLVQYDNKLPILEVALYKDGVEYAAPSGAEFNIRVGKKDRKFVNNPALGWDTSQHKIYFEITQQMVVEYGTLNPVVEMVVAGQIAASSPLYVVVDKNPVQEGDVESTTEYKTIQELVAEAQSSATKASSSEAEAKKSASEAASSASSASGFATNAQNSAAQAAVSATGALGYKNQAQASATEAKTAADNAGTFSTNASASATKAAESEKTATAQATAASKSAGEAKTSATEAKASATDAGSYARSAGDASTAASTSASQARASATQAGTSATNAATSAQEAADSADAADLSAVNAKVSETQADKWQKYAKSYAIGDSGVRDGEDMDNAMYYSIKASEDSRKATDSATMAAESETAAAKSAKDADESCDISMENATASATNAGLAEAARDAARQNANEAGEYSEAAAASATTAGNAADDAKTAQNRAASSAAAAAASEANAKKSEDNAKASADKAAEIASGDFVLHSEFPELDTQGVNLFGFVLGIRALNGTVLDKDKYGFHVSKSNITDTGVLIARLYALDVKEGEAYTVSGKIRATKTININMDLSDGAYETLNVSNLDSDFVVTLTCGKSIDGNDKFFDISTADDSFSTNDAITIYVTNFKLERGTVTHPIWTPAPQDVLLKPKHLKHTMTASKWTGSAFPYLYALDISGLTTEQNVYVTADMPLSQDQINAFSNSCITGYKQEANKITLQAIRKPTINLPIVIDIFDGPISTSTISLASDESDTERPSMEDPEYGYGPEMDIVGDEFTREETDQYYDLNSPSHDIELNVEGFGGTISQEGDDML